MHQLFPSRRLLAGFSLTFMFGLTTALPAQDAMPEGLSDAEQTQLVEIVAKRHAKRACSGVFLSGRTAEEVLLEDHDTDPITTNTTVDRENGTVTVSVPFFPGEPSGTAVYRNGLGCTILHELTPAELRSQPTGRPPSVVLDRSKAWPDGSSPELANPAGLDRAALEQTLARALSEPYSDKEVDTRGVAVVYDGQLVAEGYGPGFAPDRPLVIWSMSKSVTNALVGMMVKDGMLDLEAPAPVPAWHHDADDPRAAITLDQLMRMSSGLDFEEVYEPRLTDVVVMLFGDPSSADYAARQPLEAPPDTKWHYSSGTTNILSAIVKGALDNDLSSYVALPHERVFRKLGMSHTILELDEAGTFVGSSHGYSTPRDLARYGQLWLQDGVWKGERILPEGWVEYSTTPTPKAPRGVYGAQFWLNAGDPEDPSKRRWRDVPTDAFGMSGFEGQSVTVVPSRKAVIVRLGRTPDRSAFDLNRFLADVLDSLPE